MSVYWVSSFRKRRQNRHDTVTRKSDHARPYQQHGAYALENALAKVGSDAWMDELGLPGEALRAWRQGLIDDLGGEDKVSTAQLALVDLAVRSYLMLEHIDRWVLSTQNIVNKRDRKVFRIVLDRQRMADSLAKYLGMLGLEKRTLEGENLTDYIEARYSDGGGDSGG